MNDNTAMITLAKAIDRLANAVEGLAGQTYQLPLISNPPESAGKTRPETVSQPAAPSVVETPEAPEFTIADVRRVMARLGKTKGLALLAEYDVQTVPALPEEAYPSLMERAAGMVA